MKKTIIFIISFFYIGWVKCFEIAPHLHYEIIHQNPHTIHLLEIDPHYYQMKPILAKQVGIKRQTVSEITKEKSAIAGINGGFFALDEKGIGTPAGVLKIQGRWIHLSEQLRAAIGWNDKNKLFFVDRIKTSKINKQKPEVLAESDPKQMWNKFENIIGGTPLLIKEGKPIEDHQLEKTLDTFLTQRHARTAVCMTKNQRWLWVVVSHSKEKDRAFLKKFFEGFTITELTDFLKEKGCIKAINLDGGGSSSMVIQDSLVNFPTGDWNNTLQHYQERPVTDAILLFPRTD